MVSQLMTQLMSFVTMKGYNNTSIPDSLLIKKMHLTAYHICREAVEAGTIQTAKRGADTNFADLFIKILSRLQQEGLLHWFTY